MNDFIIILGVIIVLIINELFVLYLFKKHPKLIYKLYVMSYLFYICLKSILN